MTKDLNEMGNVSCSLKIMKPIPHFDEIITLNIYRIIQEALTNIVKHAEAQNVVILAGATGKYDFYDFQITDDGIGFNTENGEYGVGIPSMSDRVKMLGGQFKIYSKEGKGTKVVVEVPID
jgi:signal transduction histidine kinase